MFDALVDINDGMNRKQFLIAAVIVFVLHLLVGYICDLQVVHYITSGKSISNLRAAFIYFTIIHLVIDSFLVIFIFKRLKDINASFVWLALYLVFLSVNYMVPEILFRSIQPDLQTVSLIVQLISYASIGVNLITMLLLFLIPNHGDTLEARN